MMGRFLSLVRSIQEKRNRFDWPNSRACRFGARGFMLQLLLNQLNWTQTEIETSVRRKSVYIKCESNLEKNQLLIHWETLAGMFFLHDVAPVKLVISFWRCQTRSYFFFLASQNPPLNPHTQPPLLTLFCRGHWPCNSSSFPTPR